MPQAPPIIADPSREEERDRFLGSLLSRQHVEALTGPCDGSASFERPAAVLFVDVSGFTGLTESFAAEGRRGAEHLSDLMRRTFRFLIDRVTEHGGDITAFAGDAIWATWTGAPRPLDSPEPTSGPRTTDALSDATCCAAEAAWDVIRRFPEELQRGRIRIRATVGVGTLNHVVVRGQTERVDFIIMGNAILDAGAAGAVARPGDVILSGEAAKVLSARARGTWRERSLVVSSLELSRGGMSAPPAPRKLLPTARNLIRNCLPQYIVKSADSRLVAWLAEFRKISVAFLRFDEERLLGGSCLEPLELALRCIEARTRRLAGTVHQVLMDEKGLTVVLAFGLPSQSHEDDALRAVTVGLEIQHCLAKDSIRVSIGVTTGFVFCDVCGTDARRSYIMIGSAMNLASRLMQSADGSVICDAKTASSISGGASIRLEPFRDDLAGGAPLLEVYRAISTRQFEAVPPRRFLGDRLVGRQREWAELLGAAVRLEKNGTGGAVVLEGEAGIGKSRLVKGLLPELVAAGIRPFQVQASSIDSSTQYYALRSLFTELLRLDASPASPESRRERCLARLRSIGQEAWAPLLNVVLSIEFEENASTEALTEEGRAERTRELLAACIQESANVQPTALIIEDAHWLDSASWACLLLIVHEYPNVLVITTTRPIDADRHALLQQLLERPGSLRLVISPLAEADIQALLCERLRVDTIPPAILALISARAMGNPFFSIEIAYALRDAGTMAIEANRCTLVSHDPGHEFDATVVSSGLPESLQDIVAGRMSRLEPRQQLVLKVAAAIGRDFCMPLLRAVTPLPGAADDLDAVVNELVAADLLRTQEGATQTTYSIGHAIVAEAVYATIAFRQRKVLHGAIARWCATNDSSQQVHAILAYHFERAAQPVAAIEHCEMAGAIAMRHFAHGEAVQLYSTAVRLINSLLPSERESPDWRVRCAKNEILLGRAHLGWSKYMRGSQHIEAGLQLLGRRLPRATPWVALGSIWELSWQLALNLFMTERWRRPSSAREMVLLQARAYEGLTECYFNLGENSRCLHAALVSLNTAERGGPSAELARGYSSLGALLGFIPWDRAARAYCQQAMRVARTVGDRAAQAWVAVATGVYHAGAGRWQEAADRFAETAALAAVIGDSRRSDDSSVNLTAVALLRGHVDESLAIAIALESSARRRNDRSMYGSAVRQKAHCALFVGDLPSASGHLAELKRLRYTESNEATNERHIADTEIAPIAALIHLRRCEYDEARSEARLGLSKMLMVSPMFYIALHEYAMLAETFLSLPASGDKLDAIHTKMACRQLRRFARPFPIARPAALLFTGVEHALGGRFRQAERQWQRAIGCARELGMPYWEAMAHLHWGRSPHCPRGVRQEHLSQAVAGLAGLTERHYARVARHELEQLSD